MEGLVKFCGAVVAAICLILFIYGMMHFSDLTKPPSKDIEDMNCSELFEKILSGQTYCQSGDWEGESYHLVCLSGWMESSDIMIFAIEQGCIEFKGD